MQREVDQRKSRVIRYRERQRLLTVVLREYVNLKRYETIEHFKTQRKTKKKKTQRKTKKKNARCNVGLTIFRNFNR